MSQKTTILFKEWLPDQPPLLNSGLMEALNTIPRDGTYKQYLSIDPYGATLGSRCQGAFAALDTDGSSFIYAGNNTALSVKSGGTWTELSGATYSTAANGYWRFAQYEDLVIATNYADVPQASTIGAGATFGALATGAPFARQIGVIGQFVVLGDLNNTAGAAVPHKIQWSAIDDPRNFPTPNSSTAIASQAGEQYMPAELGAVTGIFGGDQYGIVGQNLGISRMSYIGGNAVFQFDTIERGRGIWFPNSAVEANGRVYFIAADGFFVTNGVTVEPIGKGKVDSFFLADVDQTYRERVTGAVDIGKNCIFWSYPNNVASSGTPNRLICFNYAEHRFTHINDNAQIIFNSFSDGYTLDQLTAGSAYPNLDDIGGSFDSSFWQGGLREVSAFSSDGRVASFTGDPLEAVFQTGELNPNPGGYFRMQGARPIANGLQTAVSMSLATRDEQTEEELSFGTAGPYSSRSGLYDFNNEFRYGALQMRIPDGFTSAMGIEMHGVPTSEI